jgi:hypothetical protein
MPSAANLELLTRIGFAARGLLYLSIGYLALRFGRTENTAGAIEYLAEGSTKPLVGIMAVGFLAYGIWRLSEAIADTEGQGTDAKGMAARIGGGISGVIHMGLAFVALNLVLGNGGQQGGGNEASSGAATALEMPGGHVLVLLAGLALIGTGLYQLVKAAKASFLKHLDMHAAHKPWVKWFGRAGYAARGVVFTIIGWSLLQAGMAAEADQANGMEQAIDTLAGGSLFVPVAIGLLLFGLFSFVEARHRQITDPQVIERLKGAMR